MYCFILCFGTVLLVFVHILLGIEINGVQMDMFLSPPHTRASGWWARRLVCPFAQQIALVRGEFSWEFGLARSWGKNLSCLIFFCLAKQSSQRVRAMWASSLARKINRPMKTHIFFTWFILSCIRGKKSWSTCIITVVTSSFLYFFFWISQIILNESGMSLATKHFGSSVAL